MDLHQRLWAIENLAAQFWQRNVAPAGNEVVGQLHDGLFAGFVRHFRTAQHNDHVRRNALEHGDDLGGFVDVPYIYTEADDLRPVREQLFDHLGGLRTNHELLQHGLGLQLAHVRQQIA